MLHHVLEDIGTLSSSSSTLQAIILLRREHQDGGWMHDLLRGRVRYYFKSVSPPPSEVRRTSCRRLFQRMGNLEAGIAAHLRKPRVKTRASSSMYYVYVSINQTIYLAYDLALCLSFHATTKAASIDTHALWISSKPQLPHSALSLLHF